MRVGVLGPSFSEERTVDLIRFDPPRLPNDRSKDIVLDLHLFPPEY